VSDTKSSENIPKINTQKSISLFKVALEPNFSYRDLANTSKLSFFWLDEVFEILGQLYQRICQPAHEDFSFVVTNLVKFYIKKAAGRTKHTFAKDQFAETKKKYVISAFQKCSNSTFRKLHWFYKPRQLTVPTNYRSILQEFTQEGCQIKCPKDCVFVLESGACVDEYDDDYTCRILECFGSSNGKKCIINRGQCQPWNNDGECLATSCPQGCEERDGSCYPEDNTICTEIQPSCVQEDCDLIGDSCEKAGDSQQCIQQIVCKEGMVLDHCVYKDGVCKEKDEFCFPDTCAGRDDDTICAPVGNRCVNLFPEKNRTQNVIEHNLYSEIFTLPNLQEVFGKPAKKYKFYNKFPVRIMLVKNLTGTCKREVLTLSHLQKS